MNIRLANELMRQLYHPHEAPGSLTTFLEHPWPPIKNKSAVHLGIVMEHRFAFCHWIAVKRKLLQKSGQADAEFTPPDLVSFDWHNDFGAPADYKESQLRKLNQDDENEVAFFAWAGLRSLNDGHILPALWLNAINDVYIVLKQGWEIDRDRNQVIKDRFGREHNVFFFRKPKDFAREFLKTGQGSGVIWDLDLDYLTKEKVIPDQRYTEVLSNRQIKSVLSPHTHWMQLILGDLKAITIALEPEYTGGITQSLQLFRHWEKSYFTASVYDHECHWKDDIFD